MNYVGMNPWGLPAFASTLLRAALLPAAVMGTPGLALGSAQTSPKRRLGGRIQRNLGSPGLGKENSHLEVLCHAGRSTCASDTAHVALTSISQTSSAPPDGGMACV